MLITDYAQLIHYLSTGVALLISVGAIGYGYTTRRFFNDKYATGPEVTKLRADVAGLGGDCADLAERFSRFQKREGMRAARSEKEKIADMQREAANIMAAGGAPEAPQGKLGLYRKLGGRS